MLIKIQDFSGPLDLLLRMIEKEKMDITKISLSKIADDYIDFIKKSNNITTENMADFLAVAAKLLLIKSRALLPFLQKEEEEDIEEFEKQLKMYQEFADASAKLEKIIGKKKFMFEKPFNRKVFLQANKLFSPPGNLNKNILVQAMEDLLAKISVPEEDLEEQEMMEAVSIEEKIALVEQKIIKKIKFGFREILKNSRDKTEVIVSFLAVLELAKQKRLVISQEDIFGEMIIDGI